MAVATGEFDRPWELKAGDVLDYHEIWEPWLGGRDIDSQLWTVSDPSKLTIVAQSKNTSIRTLSGASYRVNTVASVWLRTGAVAEGDVIEITNRIISTHSPAREITASRWIEIVRLYETENEAELAAR